MPAVSYEIQPFQLAQYRDSLGGLTSRFTNYFAGVNFPLRLITRTRPFSFATLRQDLRRRTAPLDDLRDLLIHIEDAQAYAHHIPALLSFVERRQEALARALHRVPPDDPVWLILDDIAHKRCTVDALAVLHVGIARIVWPWQWLKTWRRSVDTIEKIAPPLTLDHYLLAWPGDHTDPDALRATIKDAFLLPDIRATPLPALFSGSYRAAADHLVPIESGQPFMTIMTAYDIRGEWQLGSWTELLMGDHELSIAIDIHSMNRATANQKTNDAFIVLKEAIHGKNAVKDARAEDAFQGVNYVMQRLNQQTLHNVSYALMLQAPTLSALKRSAQTIRDVLGARMRLDRVPGAQAEYLKLFTTTAAKEIAAPLIRRNTLSQSVAVKIPWGHRKTSRTNGPCWGYDPYESMPIYYQPWGDHGFENAHMMMIGQSGSGKTVYLLTLALRHAVDGNQIVFFEPLGKSAWLCDAVGAGAAYYQVETDAAINILDPLTTDMKQQRDHVLRKLNIVLGKTLIKGEEIDFTAREFDNFEIGAVDRALQHPRIYGPAGSRLPTLSSANPPILEDLVLALRRSGDEDSIELRSRAAHYLADEIESVLLGSSSPIFNAPTTLSWHFDRDVVGYNFQGADKGLLPLYYDHGFEALNRWVRSNQRKQRWPHIITIIDEFKFMASVKALEWNVAMATKTWRNHGGAMWTADQNATAYFGQEGLPTEWGPFVSENVLIKVFGKQEGVGADILGRIYANRLSPQDIESIKVSKSGEFITLLGEEVHHLRVQLTDIETPYFLRK